MQSELDDLPVGGGGQKNAPPEEFASSSNQAVDNSGPLEQRIVSKNWLVRANAFEELTTLFKSADNQHSQDFRDHAGSWKKYLADANPGSLEKCLDALEVFINRADPKLVSSCQNDIIKILIEKCVGHAKAIIKTKSLECFNLLFEVSEAFDDSIDTIAETLGSKNIKISTYALVTLNSWISSYGVKKVKVKPFLQLVENLASQSNPQARAEAMNFYKECYIFLGEGLKSLISGLKKQQLDDLDKEFIQLKDKPKPQLRYTRTEKEKMKDAALDDIIKKEEEESKGADTYDLFDAVDLLTKYGASEWQDKVSEAKAWKEKKDLLDELFNDSNVPKIKGGDFMGIAKLLKKMMGDSNIVVSQTSIKVCGSLAKGLRQEFEQCCKELLPTLIAKFREKKTQVIEETNNVLTNFLLCTNLEIIREDLIAGLQDKAPSVKKFICLFIEKAAQETYIDVLQRISNEMLAALIKASDDPQSEVRDAALQALGIFKGRLGESAMSKFLQDLNPQKLAKLNESAQNVKPSKYDRPEKKVTAPEPQKAAPPAKKKPAAATEKKPAAKKQDEVMEDVTAKTQNTFDDQPIGGNKKNNAFDEQPIGGGKKTAPSFDDQPIGGNKAGAFDEQPIGGGNKGGFDAGADAEGDEIPIKRGAYNLDNLDDMDAFGGGGGFGNPPPIKKKPPPKAAVKKPVEEEKKADDGDVIMNDDAMMSPKKTEVKKPPPKKAPEEKKTSTSTTVAAKTTSKGPTGPQIQEEDVGTGLSKEEAEAKVQENFPSEIVSKFEEAKWQDKVEGFKNLGQAAISSQPGQDLIEALVKFVKMKMKDWKESNLNLIKESIAFFLLISQNCEKVGKRAVACMMPFLCDKIGDVKLVNNISETLMNLSEIVTPKFICLQVIKYVASAKAPNTIKEGCNVLIKMTDEFGVLNMAPKEMIDFGILAANNTNPQVRTQSMALFAIMYQHAGETIKNFLKDIKESTLKLIEEEFGKVTPFKKGEYQQKRNFRGEAAAIQQAAPKKGGAGGGGGGGLASLLDDAMPRQDITKLLGPKLMPMFKHADWKVRKQAADQVEEICRGANMRIQPLGLGELMDNIKQRMVDPNKAVLKAYIQLQGIVVEALGPAAKQFQKKILPGMLATLADKQSLVRGDAIACMDKWAEHVGPEVIINNVGPMLTQENPELRTEALKWIIKQKDSIKNTEMKEYVKALVSCLSDKTPAIRNLAEEVCGYVMPFTGYPPFQAVISDLLPAVANTIKPILERIKKNVGPMNVPVENMNGSSGAPQQKPPAQQQQQPAAQQQTQQIQQQQAAPQMKAPTEQPAMNKSQSVTAKPQIKPKVQGAQQQNEAQKPPQQNLNQSLQPNSSLNQSMLKKKENQTPVSKQQMQPQRSESREMVKPKGLSQTISQFKQPEEEQQSVNVHFGYKEKRAEIDRKSKFQLEDIKGEQVEKLKASTSQCLGASFCAKMFSNDFKLHLECIEAFSYLMNQQPEALREILDIIFKWSLVKLQDSSNTKFAVSVFDFYSTLFQHLEESEYVFWDFESLVIVPLLCEKAGINNNILKDKVKKLLKMIYPLYDVKKCYTLIVQYGLNSKNLRAQSECLDELADYLTKFGVDNCTDKEFKLVAKMADNADKNIRENALKFMGEAYKHLDDNIWRAIGDVTPKVQGLLEQRFKKLKVNVGGLNVGNSLGQSNSQSNFFGHRDQSPKQQNKDLKSTSNIGLKKSIQQSTEMGKQSATPRSGLQFNKGPQKPDLTKSINQFNQSNKSNEEQRRTAYQDPRKSESMLQDNQSFSNKFGAPKQAPQTQRPMDTNQFNQQVHRGSEPIQQVTKSSFGGGVRQQVPPVPKQNQLFYDDDDDDLRIFTSDDHFGNDPELEKAQDEITKHIHQLKYADLSKRVDSLVSLNEMISAIDQNKPVLVRTANDLVSAFTHVLIDIFDKSVEDIPLRFAKYFITIVLKTCSCKEIMKEVSEERIFDLAEQLLTRLLIDNLDKVGDNKEGELILKNLNSSMLRLLENCNHTYIFCVLFDLLRKYKDYGVMPKLPNLIIKCLLKLSKILEKLIDKLDMEKILLAIHEYLVVINHENKTQNDEMGIRIVKTVTNELVKLKRESIWEAYRVIQCHGQADNHIYRWIQIILKSLQTQGTTPSGTQSASSNGDHEIRQLVDELRNPEKFESAILKLQRFLDQNPHIDLNDYLQECSKTFQQFIKTNLEKHRQSQIEEAKNAEEYGMMQTNLKSTGSTDNASINQPQDPVELKLNHQNSNNSMPSNRISEYQSKLASIKMRNNQKSGAETATNKQVQHLVGASGAQHNLNTSFSAMNSSLSQKWHEINKKSAVTKREGGQNIQQMSSTMGGFTSAAQNFESKIGMGGQNATQQPSNQSLGGASQGDQTAGGGATNQDLNERLAVMKAKLQALKKK